MASAVVPDAQCEHPNKRYTGALYDGPNGRKTFLYYACPDCMKTWKEEELPEPPMTPEEEEELTEDDVDRLMAEGEPVDLVPPPPQPERRPAIAVAYSVNGHLYEVAVPGDAAVQAVDGALVIRHHLGPVIGIVQVVPVISEEGADGAE